MREAARAEAKADRACPPSGRSLPETHHATTRRSRKPLSVVRRIEGSNPSPSASLGNRFNKRFLAYLVPVSCILPVPARTTDQNLQKSPLPTCAPVFSTATRHPRRPVRPWGGPGRLTVPGSTSRVEIERVLAKQRFWIEQQRRRQLLRLGLERLLVSESEARLGARCLLQRCRGGGRANRGRAPADPDRWPADALGDRALPMARSGLEPAMNPLLRRHWRI
jgi:hypothetical protein